MLKHVLLLSLCGLSACSTVHYTPNVQQSDEQGVRVLFEYPQDVKFRSLGMIDVNHYQPGWAAPTVSDVLPELKAKAASVGGNALIVRSHQVGQFDRTISISAEALAVEWSGQKN